MKGRPLEEWTIDELETALARRTIEHRAEAELILKRRKLDRKLTEQARMAEARGSVEEAIQASREAREASTVARRLALGATVVAALALLASLWALTR
ncbi:MAG: hypothetical protein ACE5Q3_13250 [Alphaproteobacteria bacterium]